MAKQDMLEEISKKLRDNYLEQKQLMDEYVDICGGSKKKSTFSYLKQESEVPKSIRRFLDLEDDVVMNRIEILENIYQYIKDNDLINKKKRTIDVDKSLKKALKLSDNDKLNFYNIQKYIDDLY